MLALSLRVTHKQADKTISLAEGLREGVCGFPSTAAAAAAATLLGGKPSIWLQQLGKAREEEGLPYKSQTICPSLLTRLHLAAVPWRAVRAGANGLWVCLCCMPLCACVSGCLWERTIELA